MRAALPHTLLCPGCSAAAGVLRVLLCAWRYRRHWQRDPSICRWLVQVCWQVNHACVANPASRVQQRTIQETTALHVPERLDKPKGGLCMSAVLATSRTYVSSDES